MLKPPNEDAMERPLDVVPIDPTTPGDPVSLEELLKPRKPRPKTKS